MTWAQTVQESPSLHIGELPMMVGSSRQIVLWKPAHFAFFKTVLERWKLDDSCYRIHSTVRGRDTLFKMAADANLSLGISLTVTQGIDDGTEVKSGENSKRETSQVDKSFQQIDPIEIGDQPLLVKNRCGVVTQTHAGSALGSSFELVLLVLVSLTLQG